MQIHLHPYITQVLMNSYIYDMNNKNKINSHGNGDNSVTKGENDELRANYCDLLSMTYYSSALNWTWLFFQSEQGEYNVLLSFCHSI